MAVNTHPCGSPACPISAFFPIIPTGPPGARFRGFFGILFVIFRVVISAFYSLPIQNRGHDESGRNSYVGWMTARPETSQPQECVRNCSASAAGEARRLTGFIRPSHRLPPQLHRTTGARREKPVVDRSFHPSKKLRNAAITGSENGGEVVGVALTTRSSHSKPAPGAFPRTHRPHWNTAGNSIGSRWSSSGPLP